MRLLLGGPLREPWPCPFDIIDGPRAMDEPGGSSGGGGPGRACGKLAYTSDSRFLHPPHTVDSVYECTLASRCGLECPNRLVQRGPTFRLEVHRCELDHKTAFSKGWGVRSPEIIPRGSFICEYIGE
jgi:hypothetical protein